MCDKMFQGCDKIDATMGHGWDIVVAKNDIRCDKDVSKMWAS